MSLKIFKYALAIVFLAGLVSVAVRPTQALESCQGAGSQCCPANDSHPNPYCVLDWHCQNGICVRGSEENVNNGTCDAEGSACCADNNLNQYCENGLECRSGTCQTPAGSLPPNRYKCTTVGNGCGVQSNCTDGFTANVKTCNARPSGGCEKLGESFPCNPKPTTNSTGGSGGNGSGAFQGLEDYLPGSFKFKDSSIGQIITAALPVIFGFAGIALLLYLLYGGIHLMISGGDPKVVAEAKGKITNALIGFVIVFIAFWIVQIVGSVFGLQPIVDIFG